MQLLEVFDNDIEYYYYFLNFCSNLMASSVLCDFGEGHKLQIAGILTNCLCFLQQIRLFFFLHLRDNFS